MNCTIAERNTAREGMLDACWVAQRNAAILRLMRAGEPDSAILRRYGVSRDTLNQLRGNA